MLATSTLSFRGRREYRAPDAPAATCAMGRVEGTRVSQVTPESPGIPYAMVYGLLRALPGDRALLPPSPRAVSCARLDASVEASGPHDFAVRFSTVRQRRIHVHRIPPRVRDDRETPLEWDETAGDIELICAFGKSEYFCTRGWTDRSLYRVICPAGYRPCGPMSGPASPARRRASKSPPGSVKSSLSSGHAPQREGLAVFRRDVAKPRQ